MNEDARGITPANVTAMTLERNGPGWLVTVERGNGDSIQTMNLTLLEGAQLGMMLSGGNWAPLHVDFVDHTRPPIG